MAAADLLARDVPDLRVRVVNVMDLMRLDSRGAHPHGLQRDAFEALQVVVPDAVYDDLARTATVEVSAASRRSPCKR